MCIHGLPDTHVVDVLLLLRRGGSRRLLLGRQDGCILVLLAQLHVVCLLGAALAGEASCSQEVVQRLDPHALTVDLLVFCLGERAAEDEGGREPQGSAHHVPRDRRLTPAS